MRRRVSTILILGIMLLIVAGHPVSAEEQGVKIRGVDVDGYPTVAVTVSVGSSTAPGDIRISENGSPVSILTARPLIQSGQEIDVVLAIDTSRSVQGAPLTTAISAAQTFVEGLPEGVPVGVVTFSNRARVLLGITADRTAVIRTLGSIETTQTGTALYDAVGVAAGMFAGSGQHNILLLTDGKDSGSRTDLAAAVAAAQRAHAVTFTIGLQSPTADFDALAAIASRTGGTFVPAATPDLARLYSDLAARLSRQYLVLYRSRTPGGAQVTVTVEAPGGKDSSIVLMPRLATPPPGEQQSKPLLGGSWFLALILSLSFAAVFWVLFIPLEGWTRARRDRVLAMRMSASPVGIPPPPDRPERSITGWIPDPLVRAAERVAETTGIRASLERKLELAGLPIRAGELLTVSLAGGALVGILVALLLRSAMFAAPLAAVVSAVPFFLLGRAIDRRINNKVKKQMEKAQHSFLQALDTVSKEIGEPSGPEFARVVAEIKLGRPFDEAINATADRVGSEEFKWAMLAVNIQREVGGNLAEILDGLADTVRERQAIRRQIRVLSSEGRLSVRILVALPFLITLYVIKVNPNYMKLLWTTWLGLVMIGAGAFLMVAGVVWARKLVRIDV